MQITEYETLPKDVSRSAYTVRILEIVGNIKKQKEEITKVFIYQLFSPCVTLFKILLIVIISYWLIDMFYLL